MSRTIGSTNSRTIDFIARFDKYSRDYVDPMELLFQVAAKHKDAGRGWENGHRLQAAQCLMQYRYPRLKALEIVDAADTPRVQISWLDADDVPLELESLQHELIQ